MALGHQKLDVAATVVGLTVPKGCNFAHVSVETGAIRARIDGTDPATAEGVLIGAGDSFTIYGEDTLDLIKLVEATTTDAVINIAYGLGQHGMHGIITNTAV